MISRLRSSWSLVLSSWHVLMEDKELLIYPVLSTITLIAVTILILILSSLANLLGALGPIFALTGPWAGIATIFVYSLSQYVVIVFFNTALVGAAMIRLKGGDPNLVDGLRIASNRVGSILGYAVIGATVGLLLRSLSRRGNIFSRWVIGAIGIAWNIATFLVVPVIAEEDLGPIEAVRRSVSLLRSTWGEQIIGNVSISLIFGIATIGALLLFFIPGLFVAYLFGQPLAMLPFVLILVPILLAIGLINSTLNAIFSASVYMYATEGSLEGRIEAHWVQEAFVPTPVQG